MHSSDANGTELSQRIFLARHGERADLANEQWLSTDEGQTDTYDPPLTARGFQQAHELGLRLQGERLSCIYSSPFVRALQTAHQVADVLDLPVIIEYGLSEGMIKRLFPKGPPQFKSAEHLAAALPRAQPSCEQAVPHVSYPETYGDARRRCEKTVKCLAERHPHEAILLVGHGLSVEFLAAALVKNKEVGSRNIPYCCLTECIREDQRQWRWHFGVLLQQDFLTHAESAEEAQRQRQLWGLENGSS